ncbi:MAG: insulinase family protein, partial [Gemmatimonadetes bacterium]|nr:insulinase family protein [Gemmatimonadota bacterium]
MGHLRLLLSLIVLVSIGTLSACAPTVPEAPAAQESAPATALEKDPDVRMGRLANGMRYLIRQNQKPEQRLELRLVVDVGSVLERESELGLAHFAEHMAFNGTENFEKQELVDYLESIGMRFGPDVNAYTSFDETVYMLTVPTDSMEVVTTAFQILQDWAQGVSFEAEEIDKERGVVIEEWRLGRGADQRMFDEQLPVILHASRYADRLPIGTVANLESFGHDTLRAFYQRWYRPDLMSVIAVGDLEPDVVDSLVRAHFADLRAPAESADRTYYPVPDHAETLFAIATDPEATGNSVSIYYKQDVRPDSTVDAYRRSMMESLYHGMFNRRLFELTRTANPAFLAAGSGQGRWLRTKEFYSLGARVQNNGFARGLEALLTEATRVRRHGFTGTELARQKKQILRSMEQVYRERDKTQSARFASEYVRHVLEGEQIPGIERELELHKQLLPTISLADVNALARQSTRTDNRVITVNAPKNEQIIVPDAQELLAAFDAVEASQIDPYVDSAADKPLLPDEPVAGAIVARDSIPDLGVTRWTLSNGVQVTLKPTDYKNDQILFSSFSPGGHSLVEDADYMAATTATAAVTQGGVGNFNQIELMKWLTGKVVSVRPRISQHDEGVFGSASPEDAETMFQLIFAYMTAPRPDSSAYEAYFTRLSAAIENRSSRPEVAYSDTILVTMAQYHHRARPWSLELLGEMDLDRSAAIYRDRFADAGDFHFYFVGNFDLVDMEPLVVRYLGGLPATGRQESWRDIAMDSPPDVVAKTVRRGLEPKSQTRLAFTGDFDFDNRADRIHIEMMAEAFQIKLREILREDMSGTYGVGVSASTGHYPQGSYEINVKFGCDPARVEELTDVVYTQIDSLKLVGLDSTYVAKVKEIRRREREVNLQENGWWLRVLEG